MNTVLIGYEGKKQVLIASGQLGEVNVKYNELRNANGGKYNQLTILSGAKKDQKFDKAKDFDMCELAVAGAENNLGKATAALDSAKATVKSVKSSVATAKNAAEKADKDKKASTSEKATTVKLYLRAKNDLESATSAAEASVKACEVVLTERKETLKVCKSYLKEVTPSK